jgi:hypothetical protein
MVALLTRVSPEDLSSLSREPHDGGLVVKVTVLRKLGRESKAKDAEWRYNSGY